MLSLALKESKIIFLLQKLALNLQK